LPGRRAFHTVGQLVILQLDEVHSLPAPLAGRHIEDLLDIDVDDVGFGERLVLGVLTDHLAQRRVRDSWLIVASTFLDRGAFLGPGAVMAQRATTSSAVSVGHRARHAKMCVLGSVLPV